MRNIDKLKKKCKELAYGIRKLRPQFKQSQRDDAPYKETCAYLFALHDLQHNYRHNHIAYCELRGRTRDQIERPNDNNYANEHLIEEIKAEYAWSPEEIEAYEERQKRRETHVA